MSEGKQEGILPKKDEFSWQCSIFERVDSVCP